MEIICYIIILCIDIVLEVCENYIIAKMFSLIVLLKVT